LALARLASRCVAVVRTVASVALAEVTGAVVAASEAVASVVLAVVSEVQEGCKLLCNGKTMLKCFAVVFCFVE